MMNFSREQLQKEYLRYKQMWINLEKACEQLRADLDEERELNLQLTEQINRYLAEQDKQIEDNHNK